MRINVDTDIKSGFSKGEFVSPQAQKAVFDANTFIAMKTEGESSFFQRIISISYSFHGESSRLDMHAMVIAALPTSGRQEVPRHQIVECVARFRLGRGSMTGEDIGNHILDEVAKVLQFSRPGREDTYVERMPVDG